MNILIVGGGFIGGRLAHAFLAAGHQVTVAGRNGEKIRRAIPGVHVVTLDFTKGDGIAWRGCLQGMEVVINTVGVIGDQASNRMMAVHTTGPMALFQACYEMKIPQVIQISALGADPAGATCYYRTKGKADAFLAELDPQGKIMRWSVVRPSLVVGRGGGSHGLFAGMASFPLMPRLGKGEWRVQPVHVNDLTAMIVDLVDHRESAPAWLEAVGPSPMTTDELTLALRRWLGLSGGIFIPVPIFMLRLSGWLGDRLPLGPMNSESLVMLMGDNLATAGHTHGTPPKPLPVALGLEPATQGDVWEARFSLLRLPLRWALGLFWMVSGLLPLLVTETNRMGYELLARMGATGWWADFLLYGASMLDILLGGLLLLGVRARLVGGIQIGVTMIFSLLILWFLPEFLLHPFAPLTKNIPLMAALAMMMVLEK
ncbi:MAG: SDR family oxidoreductase [Magnetococcales bacterium]|nr:SDR family oxidoreductase [Magnetococcales bacterium]NGZ26997.1 SDR family oxidoreductase [Magnetococcales bacterium]